MLRDSGFLSELRGGREGGASHASNSVNLSSLVASTWLCDDRGHTPSHDSKLPAG